jgi:hypothetical protein
MAREFDDRTLRDGFQSLTDAHAEACHAGDLDQVRRAVRGELDAPSRRALVARLALEPALAEAWRVAHALEHPTIVSRVVPPPARSWADRRWLAAAAAIALTVAGGLVVSRQAPQPDTFRSAGAGGVEPVAGADEALPRASFRLAWRELPEGSRAAVRVTGEDLRVLATFTDVTAASVRVPPEALDALQPGARVFWQVDVILPSGTRVTSETFVARIQ